MAVGSPLGQASRLMHSNRMRHAIALSFWIMMTESVPAWPVDVVPMAGFRFGGEFSNSSDPTQSQQLSIGSAASYGGMVDIPLPAPYHPRAIELYFSHQRTTVNGGELLAPPLTDLDITVLHVGLADTMQTDDPRLSWMLYGTGGATRFEAAAGHDTRPSLGAGAAVIWMANANVGVRGDLRAIMSFTGSNSSVFACNGGCSLFYSGTIVVQGEASIGIVLRFK
jgi:hypothetical protein